MGNCERPLTLTGPQMAFFREGAAGDTAGSASITAAASISARVIAEWLIRWERDSSRAMSLTNTPNTRRAAALVIAGLSLGAPASAVAIDPGVNYDPGSPAGKEYAIPLVEGRSEGAGTTNQRAGANIPFGVGITPPGGGSSAKSGSGKSGSRQESEGVRDGGVSTKVPRDRSELESRLADAESVGGTAGRTLGIALAVLLAAVLAGMALRARQGPQAA